MPKSDRHEGYRVSVVIPAYNAAAYLGRALDSVLAQTRPAAEIIVVDDGSTDDTAGVAAGYGPAVRLIGQTNGGASVARNTGIEAAGGANWIGFLDADDEWLPGKLEGQLAHLERNPQLVWTCGNFYHCHVGQSDLPLARDPQRARALLREKEYFETYFQAYQAGFYAWTSTLLVRREVLYGAGLFRPGQLRANDTDLWFRIAYRWPEIGYLPEPLAVYHRDVPLSITKVFRDSRILGDLVERHLELSAAAGRRAEFERCARAMLQVWMREVLAEGRGDEVLELVERFGAMLPFRFKGEMRMRVHYPRAAPWLLGATRVVKRGWRKARPGR